MRRSSGQVAEDRALVAKLVTRLEDPKVVERALFLLYRGQTAPEKAAMRTTASNGLGFMASHARAGTALVEKVLFPAAQLRVPRGKRLVGADLALAKSIVLRYVGTQLLDAAKAKLAKMEAAEVARFAEMEDGSYERSEAVASRFAVTAKPLVQLRIAA